MAKRVNQEDALITDIATALYEGDNCVDLSMTAAGLLSIVIPPVGKFLDAIHNEVDRLAMIDGYDEMPIVRGRR